MDGKANSFTQSKLVVSERGVYERDTLQLPLRAIGLGYKPGKTRLVLKLRGRSLTRTLGTQIPTFRQAGRGLPKPLVVWNTKRLSRQEEQGEGGERHRGTGPYSPQREDGDSGATGDKEGGRALQNRSPGDATGGATTGV